MRAFAMTAGVVAFLAISGYATTASAQDYDGDGYNDYNDEGPPPEPAVSQEAFDQTLSPYGEWVYVEPYGRVWRPYNAVVGADFRPYASNGHWVYTDQGWSFESDYNWGWATFHYGRWWMDPRFGWVWLPDTAWAPAWVSWRYGGGYVGWTPLPPRGITVVVDSFGPSWCFVETRHFVHPHFYEHVVWGPRASHYWGATVVVNNQVTYGNRRWYAGPPATHIASAVGAPIHPVSVRPPNAGYVRPVHVTSVGASYGRPPMPQGGFNHGSTPSTPRPNGYGGGVNPYPHPAPPPASGGVAYPPPHYGTDHGGGGNPYPHPAPPPESGGIARPPPNYGTDNRMHSHGGGFESSPPAGGGYHSAPPPSGGGIVPPNRGGSYAPPPSGGHAGPGNSGGHGGGAPAGHGGHPEHKH